jgi:hypothetical protein
MVWGPGAFARQPLVAWPTRARSIGQSGSSDVSSTSTSSSRFRHSSWATDGVSERIRFIIGPPILRAERMQVATAYSGASAVTFTQTSPRHDR